MLTPIAFIDDDARLVGHLVEGVKVRGTIADLPQVLTDTRAEMVIVSDPSLPARVVREIARFFYGNREYDFTEDYEVIRQLAADGQLTIAFDTTIAPSYLDPAEVSRRARVTGPRSAPACRDPPAPR